jgi:mRNA interferase MazF
VKRGEIWLCTLDPTVGSEIQKTRPCLIVSPDELNQRSPTVIVAPLTSGSRPTRFRVPVTFQGKDGLILPDQVLTLDRRRMVKRMGAVQPATLTAVLSVMTAMFSM